MIRHIFREWCNNGHHYSRHCNFSEEGSQWKKPSLAWPDPIPQAITPLRGIGSGHATLAKAYKALYKLSALSRPRSRHRWAPHNWFGRTIFFVAIDGPAGLSMAAVDGSQVRPDNQQRRNA